MENLTSENLFAFGLVVIAILSIYKLVMDAIKTFREEKKHKDAPVEDLRTTVTKHTEMLGHDKVRLDNLETLQVRQNEEMKELRTGMNVLMRSSLAMARHMMHNNNIEGLNEAERDITNYLTDK